MSDFSGPNHVQQLLDPVGIIQQFHMLAEQVTVLFTNPIDHLISVTRLHFNLRFSPRKGTPVGPTPQQQPQVFGDEHGDLFEFIRFYCSMGSG